MNKNENSNHKQTEPVVPAECVVSLPPHDFNHLDLFSGIGGFALAAKNVWKERYKTVAFCEIGKYAQKVLRKNFGEDITIIDDINKLKGDEFGTVDLITGGFPCQPFSEAGRRKGKDDERALFHEMFRIIKDAEPRWVLAENVYGILSTNYGQYFEDLCTHLEGEGYEVQPIIIPASATNAPHKRNRVWIIAHAKSDNNRGNLRKSNGKAEAEQRPQNEYKNETERFIPTSNNENWQDVATRLCGVDDGLPNRVDRLKGLGNAIVPQVAAVILAAIKAVDDKRFELANRSN